MILSNSQNQIVEKGSSWSNSNFTASVAEQFRDMTLLKQRALFVSEAITSESAKKIVSDLLSLEYEGNKPIDFYLNSPGGEVNSGFSIYDTIRYIKSPVRIISTGLCASIATIINVAVPKERRFSMPNSRFLIHQPLIHGVVQGPASDIEITANEINKTRDKLNALLAKECEQELARVEEDTLRDYWMSAVEALEYGLIGKIIGSHKELEN